MAGPQQVIAQSITLTPPHRPLPKVLTGAMSSTSTAKENVIFLTRPPSSIALLVLLLVDRGQHGHSAWTIALQNLGASCDALCIPLPLSLSASIYLFLYYLFLKWLIYVLLKIAKWRGICACDLQSKENKITRSNNGLICMNFHSSFSFQSENINISLLFPMITVYKANSGWKWLFYCGREGKQSYNGEMEEGMDMQHKTAKKEMAKESAEPVLNPLQKFLRPRNHLEDIKFGLTTIAELHYEMPRKLFSPH